MLTPREQLIARILSLAPERITDVAAFVDSLECGDVSPLSISRSAAQPLSIEPLPASALPELSGTGAESTETDRVASEKMESGDASPHSRDWPHAPVHRLSEHGTYFVTGGTLHKQHHFRGEDRLTYLESRLLSLAREYGWRLEAWAVVSNHYHFVAHAEPGCRPLGAMLKHLHGETANEVNYRDSRPDRNVWFNFWDTHLTYETSYFARLNYVHQNAVRHGLVPVANLYRWCSAAWFERTATASQVQTIYSFKTDAVNVRDDFEVLM